MSFHPESEYRLIFLRGDGVRAWAETLSSDPEFQCNSRRADFGVRLRADQEVRCFRIVAGELRSVQAQEDDAREPQIELAGTISAWSKFLQPTPPRFHNDVLGMQRRTDEFSVLADQAVLTRNLHVLHRLFEVARMTEVKHARA